MIKKLIFTTIILFQATLPSNALVKEYFNSFYYNYLSYRNIDNNDTQTFQFLHELSNNKVYWLDKFLNNPDSSKIDAESLILLIDDEYKDLKENLDFEAEYTPNCPLTKKQEKKFKKAHKKFMCQLKQKYLKCSK